MKTDNYKYDHTDWIPTTAKEVKSRGWNELDVILFTGDAYVDHPSFGASVIARIIENEGLKVAIVPQPNWRDDLRDFKKLGKPKLFFGVTAGNMDSMVNHYTANNRLRSTDAYTPGNKAGFRPNYTTIVYTNILKSIYPDTPVIIGGIEASLRRFTHYDYWSDTLKPGILYESKADLLVYGMGEKTVQAIINELKKGKTIAELKNIPQTAYLSESIPTIHNSVQLHSHDECLANKLKFAENFKVIETESNKYEPQTIYQKSGNNYIIVNPPMPLLTEKEFDSIYDLPFTYQPHPKYIKKGNIPAYEMIKHSVNIHRGCFGGCSFCTISAHQGKFVVNRSERSILKEIEKIKELPGFKGYITDLGGPSANMYKMKGLDIERCKKCQRPSCIYPDICDNLNADHSDLLNLYYKAEKIKGIKKIAIGSGVRYDMIYNQTKNNLKKTGTEYLTRLIKYHVSGRLKVAPEHTEEKTLKLIRKPRFESFLQLKNEFDKLNIKTNLNQQLIPYLISGLPGTTIKDMANLAVKMKKLNIKIEQVQEFTPTPTTLATVMYYTGINPYTKEKIVIPRHHEERKRQKLLLFWYKPENKPMIIKELRKKGLVNHINKLFHRGY